MLEQDQDPGSSWTGTFLGFMVLLLLSAHVPYVYQFLEKYLQDIEIALEYTGFDIRSF